MNLGSAPRGAVSAPRGQTIDLLFARLQLCRSQLSKCDFFLAVNLGNKLGNMGTCSKTASPCIRESIDSRAEKSALSNQLLAREWEGAEESTGEEEEAYEKKRSKDRG